MLYCSIMMNKVSATKRARAGVARRITLSELLKTVVDAIHADEFDHVECNIALACLNEALFQGCLGEQCAFQCVRGERRPSGVAFFSPARRRYSGMTELMHTVSLAAEFNGDRTVRVHKNRWGRNGEFSSLDAIEWLPGGPEYTFTTQLV